MQQTALAVPLSTTYNNCEIHKKVRFYLFIFIKIANTWLLSSPILMVEDELRQMSG